MTVVVQMRRGRANVTSKDCVHAWCLSLLAAKMSSLFSTRKAATAMMLSILGYFWPSSSGASDLPQPENKDC